MRLTDHKCKIVGVRVGEIAANLLKLEDPKLLVKFVLLRDPSKSPDGINSGMYSKELDWSERTKQAFEEFVHSLEDDALHELFELGDLYEASDALPDTEKLSIPKVPLLGDQTNRKR
jgi:hypothetical protein